MFNLRKFLYCAKIFLLFSTQLVFAQTNAPEDFKTFILKFSKNPVFQRSRVKFPLIWKEYAEEETIVHRETRATWKHYDILKPSSEDDTVAITYPTAQKPNEASVGETCKGGGCGYAAGLTFKRIGNIWYCVSRFWMSN